MLLVLFKLFFTQISQNSRIFYQARNHIIPASSHLSVLSCDVAHRFTQIFTDFYLTTTGTTITTHRSKTDLDLCHLCELLYTNDHKLSKILFTQTGRLIWKYQVQGYVFTVHDFCHERLRVGALAGISANQASLLALAAPKIQGSKPPPTPPRGSLVTPQAGRFPLG